LKICGALYTLVHCTQTLLYGGLDSSPHVYTHTYVCVTEHCIWWDGTAQYTVY